LNSELVIALAAIAAIIYAASGIMLTGRFLHSEGPKETISRGLASVGALLHLGYIYASISAGDGQNMSMSNVLSLVAWLMTVSMLLSSFHIKNTILLPVVYGFSAIALLIGISLPDTYRVYIDLNPSLVIHITLSLFAYGALMIALLYAMQVTYINSQLKDKKTAILHSSLPPLMTVESILIKLLTTGTVLLLVAVVTGMFFTDNMFDKQHIHKTVLTLIALAIYAVTLLGNWRFGWRGRTLLVSAGLGSLFLTLAYFGSRFVREVLL
jgi:ABC-type uncharacterized transport system permease subunit